MTTKVEISEMERLQALQPDQGSEDGRGVPSAPGAGTGASSDSRLRLGSFLRTAAGMSCQADWRRYRADLTR